MKGIICFKAEIAGLRFDLQCVHEETRKLCRDYLISEDSDCDISIHIRPEDIAWERQLQIRKKKPGENPESATSQALEQLHLCRRIAELLPKYDRVLFHGSVLAIDGRGVVFTAKSGTGKSTHTRLWRQEFGDRVRMVNDDKPFLHITDSGVTVYGTPWRGKHGLGENTSAPLEAVYVLCRGEENRVESMDSRELYPLLLQQTYAPDDPEAMARTLALVDRLTRNAKLRKLYCNMDPQAAHTALRGLE